MSLDPTLSLVSHQLAESTVQESETFVFFSHKQFNSVQLEMLGQTF